MMTKHFNWIYIIQKSLGALYLAGTKSLSILVGRLFVIVVSMRQFSKQFLTQQTNAFAVDPMWDTKMSEIQKMCRRSLRWLNLFLHTTFSIFFFL